MLKYIFSIVLATVFLSGIGQENKLLDKVIGVVGNNIILQSEVEAQITQYLAADMPIKENLRCEFFEDLLYQKLLLNQAALDSISVGEQQIAAEIDRRLRYFVAQFGSEKKLEEFYHKSIIEIKTEFHDIIQEQLLVQMMENQIADGVEITPSEVRAYYESIPKDSLPFINSEIELAHIVKKPPISEKEKLAARTKLEGIRERVMKGEDFGTLAILYSEDPGSAKTSGELGYTSRKSFVPEFSTAAFSLVAGETSELIETEYGYHILQLIGRRGEEINIRHILITPKVSPLDLVKAREYLDSIQQVINSVDTLTFSMAAKLFSEDEDTEKNGGKMVNPITGTAKFEMDQIGQIDPALSFLVDRMEVNDIANPSVTRLDDGTQAYHLVMLTGRTSPHIANLTDDYQRIQEVAIIRKKTEKLANWMKKKIKKTYIRIDDEYKDCEFENEWTQN